MECARGHFGFVPASPEHSATKRLISHRRKPESLTRRLDNRAYRVRDSPNRRPLANRRMVRTYCGEALPTRPASLLRWPKPFLFSFLRDTETTGDNFDELPGHDFVIKKLDRAPSPCLAHTATSLLIFHQPEKCFSDVVNTRAI